MNTYYFNGWELNGGLLMIMAFLALIGLGANVRLFTKCNMPGWAAAIPGYNVVLAMRIVGRPSSHALFFLIPGFNLYFFLKTTIELAQSFGKKTNLDFLLAAVFNVFYVLNLSLAYQEEYVGPVYGRKDKDIAHGSSLRHA
tara:strand:- start:9683 stop:10105 length:423 start_codon:yes stop_codon:yes gene_type:complete